MNKQSNKLHNQKNKTRLNLLIAAVIIIAITTWILPLTTEEITPVTNSNPTSERVAPASLADSSVAQTPQNLTKQTETNQTSPDQVYEELWSKLHDPDLRSSLTARQILDDPGFNSLSTEQMQSLVNEIMQLLKNNDLIADDFMKNLSDKGEASTYALNNIKSAPSGQLKKAPVETMATPEQEQAMNSVRELLSDPEVAKSVTASELLELPEVQSLPINLRSELAEEVIGMMSRGEINSADFFTPSQPDLAKTAAAEEIKRSAVTHDQWQAYESIQTRIQSSDIKENITLADILTSQEYKKLPPYLRQQISAEAVKLLETNNIY